MKRASKSAARVLVLDNSDPISAESEAIQRRIRDRAFELSQTRPPDAQEIYDWLIAESEIMTAAPAELIERNGAFELRFAVAGMSPDDVHVMVTPDRVALKSEYHHRHETEGGTVHLCDFKAGTVFRSISLPQTIDVDSVSVDLQDGMVLVHASKSEGGGAVAHPKRTTTRKAPAKKSRPRKPPQT
jgi:HSP20 family molecular chaperone IbpA